MLPAITNPNITVTSILTLPSRPTDNFKPYPIATLDILGILLNGAGELALHTSRCVGGGGADPYLAAAPGEHGRWDLPLVGRIMGFPLCNLGTFRISALVGPTAQKKKGRPHSSKHIKGSRFLPTMLRLGALLCVPTTANLDHLSKRLTTRCLSTCVEYPC
jgi:hypothetical protein